MHFQAILSIEGEKFLNFIQTSVVSIIYSEFYYEVQLINTCFPVDMEMDNGHTKPDSHHFAFRAGPFPDKVRSSLPETEWASGTS